MSTSNITLSPASRVFVDTRLTCLGPWVLGGFMDCILMGVIFYQVYTYFLLRRVDHGLSQYYTYLVVFVTFLSVTKTSQAIAVVWVQNVQEYGNPDVARTLVNVAWWQVSVAFMTGIIGTTVQSFFALRYYKLSRNWVFSIVICLAILLGLTGISLSMVNIVTSNVKAKVMWLLVHFVSVAIGDLLITLGTCYTLRKRSIGLVSTASLINRTLRLVFESAIPPTVIAIIDLIMSQTLGPKLLWHLFVNYSLSKVYVISLLFTLNSIAEYRKDHSTLSQSTRSDGYSNRRTRVSTDEHVILFMPHASCQRGDIELAPRAVGSSGILVETEVTTDASPDDPIAIPDLRSAMDRSQKTRSHYQKKTYPRPESPEKSRFSKF